jgi:hypothetical protein
VNIDGDITILGDLNTGVTHVRIRVPIPTLDNETCAKIREIVGQELARTLVRRNLGL